MSEVTHAELDATVKSLEAEIKLGQSEIASELALTGAKVESYEKLLEIRFGAIESQMNLIASQTSNVKVTIVVTSISTLFASVLAIVLGVASINGTLVANMLASFESGKSFDVSVNQAVARALQPQPQKETSSSNSTPSAPLEGIPSSGVIPGAGTVQSSLSVGNPGAGTVRGYPPSPIPGSAVSDGISAGSSNSTTSAVRGENSPARKNTQK